MGLVTPDYGLLFWMLLSFSILLFILKKFAWKPILHGLKAREESIAKALQQADAARAELDSLEALNKDLTEKARLERERNIQEIKQLKDKLLAEAKDEARQEAQKLMEKAHQAIALERDAATKELQKHAAQLAIQISEKILRSHLEADEKRQEFIERLIDEIPMN